MTDEVTTGEISRRLDRLEQAIADDFTATRTAITSLNFVSRDVFEESRGALTDRIVSLEKARNWVIGVVMTAVLGGLLALVIG